jgi:hypothetical protein
LLNDGTVLLVGGVDSSSNTTPSVELFDPASGGTFASGGTLASARTYHTATRLNDGTVLITGGDTFGNPFEATLAELYSPTTLTPPNLVSIAVTPPVGGLSLSGPYTLQFIATGTFSSGPTQQLASVTWSSTDVTGMNVAQISNDATNSGVAVGVSAGTATIKACTGTICSLPVTLTVGP